MGAALLGDPRRQPLLRMFRPEDREPPGRSPPARAQRPPVSCCRGRRELQRTDGTHFCSSPGTSFSNAEHLTAAVGHSLKSHHVGTDILFKIHESHSWIRESAGIKGESYFATTSSNIIIRLDSQERERRRLVCMTDSRKERWTESC